MEIAVSIRDTFPCIANVCVSVFVCVLYNYDKQFYIVGKLKYYINIFCVKFYFIFFIKHFSSHKILTLHKILPPAFVAATNFFLFIFVFGEYFYIFFKFQSCCCLLCFFIYKILKHVLYNLINFCVAYIKAFFCVTKDCILFGGFFMLFHIFSILCYYFFYCK